MDVSDAVVMAETQANMVLEGGGLMTINRLARIADDWVDDTSTHAVVMAGLWAGITDE